MFNVKRIVCFLAFLSIPACSLINKPIVHKNEVCFHDHCFEVELALTPQSHERGLMFRESLGSDQGMLFIFDSLKQRSFWMKNTKIPLDILWLNEAYRVVGMAPQAPICEHDPCPVYDSPNLSLYVLEINAGFAQKWGIQIGDKAEFKLDSL